jgi:hypothetical protein
VVTRARFPNTIVNGSLVRTTRPAHLIPLDFKTIIFGSRFVIFKIRESVVGIGDWLQEGRPRGRSSSPDVGKNFNFSMSSRPVLRFTQPPIQWVAGGGGLFPRGESERGVKMTTHLQLVPRSRKRGSIQPLLHTSSWRSA